MANFDLDKHTVFLGVSGSRLYGMSTPTSDWDYRGIALPPMSVTLDPFTNFNSEHNFEDEDKTIYSLSKFFKLAGDNNPNVLELFWVPDSMTVKTSPVWELLKENRTLFLSKNLAKKFSGFAYGQMEKAKAHRDWFQSPPDHKPTRAEFGLPKMPTASMTWLNSLNGSVPHALFTEQARDEIMKEQTYRVAKRKWDNYQKWLTTRNPARKGSEEMYGYDTKFVSHIYRLAYQARDLLTRQHLVFPLPNAEFLLDVKNGALEWETVVEFVLGLDRRFQDWLNVSELPERVNQKKLTELYMTIVKEYGIW